jgi:hypothetical protein
VVGLLTTFAVVRLAAAAALAVVGGTTGGSWSEFAGLTLGASPVASSRFGRIHATCPPIGGHRCEAR